MADKNTVPWDWELLATVMTNQVSLRLDIYACQCHLALIARHVYEVSFL